MDIQSLLDIEELHDKELEEAQELRHKCEVEERNALKAFRKAQRDLIEANAKCYYLYRKRDSFSAQFQSLMMDDSNLFLSSGAHNQFGAGLNPFADMPKLNMHVAPSSSHQMLAEFDSHNQLGNDSNIGYPNQALLNLSNYQQNGQNLGSELGSEPDTSTSDPEGNVTKNHVSAQSDDLNILTEDEGTCPIEQKSGQPNLYPQRVEEMFDEKRKDVTDELKTVDSSQDSLLLEATLRSQLFARLGVKDPSSKGAPVKNNEAAVERGAQNEDGEEKADESVDNAPFSNAEKDQTLRSQLDARVGIKDSSSKGAPFQNTEASVERGTQNEDREEKADESVDNVPLSNAEKDQTLRSQLSASVGIKDSSSKGAPVQNTEDAVETGDHNEDGEEKADEWLDNVPFSNAEKEQTLRSQLSASVGIKDSSNKGAPVQDTEAEVERWVQNEDGEENTEKSADNVPFSDAEKDQSADLGGTDSVDRTTSDVPVRINQGDVVTFLIPILRSAFGCMKVSDSAALVQSDTRHHQIHTSTTNDKKNNSVSLKGVQPIIMSAHSMKDASMNGYASSNSSNLGIDPFWPLCMHELRGKCNNSDCSLQHVRDYSSRNMNHHTSDNINMKTSLDFQGGSSPSSAHKGKLNCGTHLLKGLDSHDLIPPTYLVSSDTLKTDLHTYKSAVPINIEQGWQKYFSSTLVLSSFLSTDLPSNELFLHGADSRVEVNVGWNRQNSFFQNRNDAMVRVEQHMVDSEQALEMALLNLSQGVDKSKGKAEVLKELSRTLEVESTSVVLWILYLHIYYSNDMTIGKDDMFRYAVYQNEGSYELWLMYINSRVHLDDRLAAYNTALSSLCDHESSPDRNATHASECILDLFLQMMNCFCVSGKVTDAVTIFNGQKSNVSNSEFLTSIVSHLTIYDKCIFWVCCVYLVVYKKLPDSIVQRFEYQKELSTVDWPSTDLTVDEKKQGAKIMNLAVDSLASYIDSESLESETTLRAAHIFALNHVRCIVVVEGLECSRNLLDKYVKMYPSCLELVLMSARAREYDFGDLSFVGFEEAIGHWLEGVPGAQCIWNQYAASALQNGRFDFAKKLMERWFDSVWKIQHSRSELLDISNKTDAVFGLLNLSLHKILQNDHIEARMAIDKALKVAATTEDYKHCMKEHAMFLFTNDLESKSKSGMLKNLNSYLVDQRALLPASEPLSRMFIHSIKKPKVQQLVSNLLSPISSDFSLVNLALEVWYGPTLLPQVSDGLVDLVEAIMEISPANYQLAISLCKLLTAADVSGTFSFWASSLLVNALFQAVPVAPEYVWVEAAAMLHNLTDIESISESFHKRALLVFPFSMKLWEFYLNLSKIMGNVNSVIEAARGRGIKLD